MSGNGIPSGEPRIGVAVFPGSNCDRDAGAATALSGLGEPVYLWHDQSDLQNVEAVIVPGGFSYGDALRAGAIAQFAPLMESIRRFAEDGGLVLGVCNGFQILCEAGLLPGALTRNQGQRFVCRPVHLRVETTNSPFTSLYASGDVLQIPIAHGEGRYVCDADTLARLGAEDRILFRYAEPDGVISLDANPNGSQDNIAGIVGGPARNILGMMPHPERACDARLGSSDGLRLFNSVRARLRPSEAALTP